VKSAKNVRNIASSAQGAS